MTNTQLIALFDTLKNISVYGVRAPEGAKLPYGVVVFGSSDNFAADNKTYAKKQAVAFELYTVKKNESLEAEVEALLDEAEIPWDKDEGYDDGEQFYIIYYSITRR